MRSPKHDGVIVHRLIQDAMRENMNPNEYQKALPSAVTLVSSAWIHANSSDLGKLPNQKTLDDLLLAFELF